MDEFVKAWQELQKTLTAPPPIEYRIYYDEESGKILDYTTEIHDGTYITVDRETFSNHRFEYRVENGKVVPPSTKIGKLKPSTDGTPCHSDDITIIVTDSNAQHWKIHKNAD